jgi:hypothetical protein
MNNIIICYNYKVSTVHACHVLGWRTEPTKVGLTRRIVKICIFWHPKDKGVKALVASPAVGAPSL